jgi:integrase
MAISTYEQDGKQYFRVYVQAVGKRDKSLRVQRSKFKIEAIGDARKVEKSLIKSVTEEIGKLEGRGLTWADILYRWEISARLGHLGDKAKNDPYFVRSHIDRLKTHTGPWMNQIASELTKGDGRFVINQAIAQDASLSVLKKIKSSVNVLFNWGIEEKLILGVHSSPTDGLLLPKEAEKVPKILSLEELRKLLSEARRENHPWYPIWTFAFLTGMRSGELKALQFKDLDFEKGVIVVSKSLCDRTKKLKCTKAGYWRNVPMSGELLQVIEEIRQESPSGPEDFVLPRLGPWMCGEAGEVLRNYLLRIGINREVVFHTLRACFATHMMALGVDQATVMKIGGWKDIKTFQIYVRLAGIEVKGATDVLQIIPKVDRRIRREDNVIHLLAHGHGAM